MPGKIPPFAWVALTDTEPDTQGDAKPDTPPATCPDTKPDAKPAMPKCLLYGRDTVENRYFVIRGAVNDRVLPIEVVHGE